MPSSTINLIRQKSENREYFSVDEILRSPQDADKAIQYYDGCCTKAKNGLDTLDAGTMLYLGKVRYSPVHVTKKMIKEQKAKSNREKKHAKACC